MVITHKKASHTNHCRLTREVALTDIIEAWQQDAGTENEEYIHKGCSDDSFHIWVNVLMHKYSSLTTHAIPECL